VAAAVVFTALIVTTAWLSRPRGDASPAHAPASGVLFGAFVNSLGHGVPRREQMGALERELGRHLAIAHTFDRWGEAFPTGEERADAAAGRLPFLNLKGVPSARILDGSQDAYIRERARAVKEFDSPLMIQYYGEMDRRSAAAVGTPPEFVRAWRHIHDLFADEGAGNAIWVWCATGDGLRGDHPHAVAFYPGDAYVDWVCFDVYDWPRGDGRPHRSFADIALEPYRYLTRHMPGKPVMIGEFGTVEDPADPGAKARWFDQAAQTVARQMPAIRALVYFDTVAFQNGRRIDWRLTSSPQAYDAWLRWARRPYFSASAPS
jgi:hypothetical protein